MSEDKMPYRAKTEDAAILSAINALNSVWEGCNHETWPQIGEALTALHQAGFDIGQPMRPSRSDERWQKLKEFVDRHQRDIVRIHFSGDLVDEAASLIEHYHTQAIRTMSHQQSFQAELLTTFRALALVADSVGSAHTHGEKNARLRGLIDVLNGAYDKISKWRFDAQCSYPSWGYEDVFRADYPAKHYLNKIEELQREVTELKRLTGKTEAKAQEEDDVDPFADK